MQVGQAVPPTRLKGWRIHLAGSANATTPADVIARAHEIVKDLVPRILEKGGGIVVGAGKEPRGRKDGPALVFDWTVIEGAMATVGRSPITWPAPGFPIVVVTSEKSVEEIPEDRRALWETALRSCAVQHERILPGARSGALLRERQALFGDVLLTMGGGTGVEHLAELYLEKRRPVIPLDIPLGASREDGTGGSERLAGKALACPSDFIEVAPGLDAGALLTLIGSERGRKPAERVVQGIVQLLEGLTVRKAFAVRLMNRSHAEFGAVESLFRAVVDPEVEVAGYQRVDLAVDVTGEPFLNVEVFRELHYASLAVVDLTGLRSNCFLELGYALGRPIPTLITCKRGTEVPFDPEALPRYEWDPGEDNGLRRESFRAFWQKNIGRLPVVHRDRIR